MTYQEMPYDHLTRLIAAGQDDGRGLGQQELQRRLWSGDATFRCLIEAINSSVSAAPPDHDVLIEMFGVFVRNVKFIQPHTFIFYGSNAEGHFTVAVAHFSQVVAHIVFRPKKSPQRVITGFAKE